jgi:hypothetical protein
MKVYNGTQNCSDLQVENGCYFLLFDLKKDTAYPGIQHFFNDLNLSTADNLKVLYTSRKGGQRTLVPSLPVFPLAIAATMGPQHIIAYQQGGSTNPTYINRVVFPVMIGAGGALTLDDNSYVSVSTGFGNVSALSIYAVDTVKSALAFVYESIHLNASNQKSIDLTNCNQLILSKQLRDFQLLTRDSVEYSVNWDEKELEAVARAQNDVLAVVGTELTGTRVINGESVAVVLGIQNLIEFSGGTFYDAIGVTDFSSAKVTTLYDDRAYVLRVTDTSTI